MNDHEMLELVESLSEELGIAQDEISRIVAFAFAIFDDLNKKTEGIDKFRTLVSAFLAIAMRQK